MEASKQLCFVRKLIKHQHMHLSPLISNRLSYVASFFFLSIIFRYGDCFKLLANGMLNFFSWFVFAVIICLIYYNELLIFIFIFCNSADTTNWGGKTVFFSIQEKEHSDQKGCAFLSAVSPELSLHSALSDSRGSRKEKNLPLQGNQQISL